MLFSTHILSDVEQICTDVAFLAGGRIALSGSVSELKRAHGAEEFTVEMSCDSGYRFLFETFPDAKPLDGRRLSFHGDCERAYHVLDRVRESGYALRSFVRSDASLEALFMEVAGK